MNDSDYERILKKFLIPLLRRRSLWWPPRNRAKSEARVGKGLYKCEICEQAFSFKEIQMDHKIPVIDVKTQFTNWDSYIRSLFCEKSNFAAVCKSCHYSKTLCENEQRAINKRKMKK